MSGEGTAAPYRQLLIGITGPIGCGKSTVAAMLGELGGTVIDADGLARRATDPGRPTLALIRARFGEDVFLPDGELDRAAMARRVFDDSQALIELESIIHPEVRTMLEEELARAELDQVPFVVIEAIKLVEGGLSDRCDQVWLIQCEAQTQLLRLLDRGTTPADAESRIAAQGPDLVERLAEIIAERPEPRPVVRRLSTEGSLEAVRELAEDALADALAGGNPS